MWLENLKKSNDAIIAGDTEFSNELSLPKNYSNFKELKKIICTTHFVMVQLATPDSDVKIYEHPDVAAGLLPTWDGNCVLSNFLNFDECQKTNKNKKVKTFNIAYLFYFSAYDIFGLFKDKNTQINIAKQLSGGRIMREKSFPNHLRTGVFIEVPSVDKKGNHYLEVKEIAIKLYDAKGYTPAGVSGLNKTFETWGVKFENKTWLKYFDISNFKSEYLNTVDMVEIPVEDGTKWMSKHQIVASYARGDGLKEMFTLYNNVHHQARNTLDKMGYFDYDLKNFKTIGNIANQVGVAACLNGLNMSMTKDDEIQIAQYFYPSSAYSLLENSYGTVRELLNVDGGFCKNMKPTYPVIRDLTIDNDLAGAYAEAMRSLPYIIGIPSVISYPYDRENRANFYQEFNKLRKKQYIYDGAWVARVSTIEPLTFKQDLIFSKIFGATDFEKSQIEDEDGFFIIDDSKIDDLNDKGILSLIPDGSFQLLNNEIISGILTHDLLQFIELFWSKSEKKELFSKLRIDSMIFYHKKFLVTSDEFKNEFSKLNDTIVFNFNNGISIKDKRKPIWCVVPTDEGWFGDLTHIRNNLKTLSSIAKKLTKPNNLTDDDFIEFNVKLTQFLTMPNLTDNDKFELTFILDCVKNKKNIDVHRLNELAIKYKCEQNGFKCVNNSTYGVTGSPLWQQEKPSKTIDKNGKINEYSRPKIGNMVFAQNVTARVRLGAYCMCKSSNGYSVITDGTQSNLNEFWFWRWKSSTNHVFGSQELWNLSRYNKPSEIDPKGRFEVKLAPLGNNGKWVLVAINEENKTVTIKNNEITITGGEENWKLLDSMSYLHAKSLFGELDIFKKDVMKYASKDVYKGAAFQSQANYLFEKFFKSDKDVLGNETDLKIKARGYNLSKCVYYSPDLTDEKMLHPYEEMINKIYNTNEADIYLKSVYSPQLLGIDDFNKSENVTTDYIMRGFLPHSPTYRSSKPSPFSLSMFRWNTRKQYETWDKKIESWKNKTGFGLELLFLDPEIVENRKKLKYSEVVNKIQELIDDNISPHLFDKRIIEKLNVKHPQLFLEENLACELI
jgi:hypothetical protein